MSIPVEKLVDARVDQFSWFFEDEELELIRSHKGSLFEKKEAEKFSKVNYFFHFKKATKKRQKVTKRRKFWSVTVHPKIFVDFVYF